MACVNNDLTVIYGMKTYVNSLLTYVRNSLRVENSCLHAAGFAAWVQVGDAWVEGRAKGIVGGVGAVGQPGAQ